MAATLQQIANYLDNLGWDYRLDEEEDRIITGVESENIEDFLIVVQLDEEGKFFRLFAPQVLAGVKDHPYKAAILQSMLAISWETKMLQWEYDPSDGEIRAIIEFPLEDSILTEKQFNRCLSGLIQLIDSVALPRLKAVMETGQDPGNVELGERLLLSIQEQAPGLLELLEKAMEARKKRGSFPGE
ncbi:MAG: YbjN domain-containing protein [Fischerella sp.]|nr:YbjN domain-containing protein [Fischerella sp.]